MQTYDVTGMSCAACSARVEKVVRQVEGVTEVSVNLLTNSMNVEGEAASQQIIDAVTNAGYGASLHQADLRQDTAGDTKASQMEENQKKAFLVLRNRLVASLIFLVPLMYLSMGYNMWGWPLPESLASNPLARGLWQMLLTIVIMVINQRFFISGFVSACHRSPNMDTLVALGAGASFGYSVYGLFQMTETAAVGSSSMMENFYFESAGMILTLITVGKMLEAYSKGRTTDALKGLMELAPRQAVVLRDGKETILPVDAVVVGDLFVVRPGESIPVDGVVISGESAVDESAISGESIPVDKKEGDEITAATINVSGHMTARALRVGQDTTLARIIHMVSDASATKAPIAKVADKVAGIFVPAVLLIAEITFLAWMLLGESFAFALSRGICVLVISCPCALGLATPVAIMVGNGVGAKNGILFKNAAALEETGRIRTVVLDKTGTITKGMPVVTDVVTAEGIGEEELLQTAVSLEYKSEHPLAKAILSYGEEKGILIKEVDGFQSAAGNGLSGQIDQVFCYGGKEEFISTSAETSLLSFASAHDVAGYGREGKTPLFFAKEHHLLGMICVADAIKEDSADAVAQLKDMGIRVVMLTGDREETAQAIGKKAGVDEVIAGVLPDGKEEKIRQLSEAGHVMMVGDGINDAPALTRADVGVAIGAGADIAMDAADVVLMNSHLSDVTAAIRLSKKTLRNIHENLFWAFFYNALGIPLAAGLWYPFTGWELSPMFGAAAMSLSSFCVVTNALRLNFVRLHAKEEGKQPESGSKAEISDREEKENKKMEKTLLVNGMMCPHCEAHVKEALEKVEGVQEASADHTAGEVVVKLTAEVSEDTLKATVKEAGYECTGVK